MALQWIRINSIIIITLNIRHMICKAIYSAEIVMLLLKIYKLKFSIFMLFLNM